jgi:DNA end-binding protein Ku
LHFDYEVRSADAAFSGIPERKIEGEMLDLAKHIIETKRGRFDPHDFKDRYEAALGELVKAKQEGRPIVVPKAPAASNVIDLMEALRQSAGVKQSGKTPEGRKKTVPAHKGRAGSGRKAAAKKKTAAKPARTAASGGRRRKQG